MFHMKNKTCLEKDLGYLHGCVFVIAGSLGGDISVVLVLVLPCFTFCSVFYMKHSKIS